MSTISSAYLVGEVARLDLTITDLSGAAADPGALRLKIKPPSGVVATYVYGAALDLVKDGIGRYHYTLLLDAAGAWALRWEADAPNAGAAESMLVVQASRL